MKINYIICGGLIFLSGCVHPPLSPSAAVMPGPSKPFDLFVQEDHYCKDYAQREVGVSPQESADRELASDAITGTVIGAAAGTAIGAAVGHIGPGAIVGAGMGLAEGTAIGASNGYHDSWNLQRRYDIAYEQCMYAKGNQIPGVPIAYAPPPPPPSQPKPKIR